MSWLSKITGRDAYEKAQKAYEQQMQQSQQQYGQAQQNLQPFVDQGQEGYGSYKDAMMKLMNPAALQDEFMKSYEPSEQAKYTSEMAGQEGLDAASSMGLMGSTPALGAIQAGKSQIMADDKQKYIDNLMQKYLAGAGIAGNIYSTGANMAGQQANIGSTQAGSTMASGGPMSQFQYGQNMAGPNMLGNIGGLVGGLATSGANMYMMSKLYPNLFGGSK